MSKRDVAFLFFLGTYIYIYIYIYIYCGLIIGFIRTLCFIRRKREKERKGERGGERERENMRSAYVEKK